MRKLCILDELILWTTHYMVQYPWHQKAKRTEEERGRKGEEGKAFVSLVLRAHSLMRPSQQREAALFENHVCVCCCVCVRLIDVANKKKRKREKIWKNKTPNIDTQFFKTSSVSVISFIAFSVSVLSEGLEIFWTNLKVSQSVVNKSEVNCWGEQSVKRRVNNVEICLKFVRLSFLSWRLFSRGSVLLAVRWLN